jgi:hypothetical protein
MARNAPAIDGGIDFVIRRNLALGVSYSGQIGRAMKDPGVRAALLWNSSNYPALASGRVQGLCRIKQINAQLTFDFVEKYFQQIALCDRA